MKKNLFRIMALVAVAAVCAMAQKVKTTDEGKGIQEIQKAKTPDEIMAAVDKFVVGFPNSEFKSQALSAAAEAAEQKGGTNWTKAVSYGDLAIAADPNNFDALLLVAAEIAQHTPENSLTNELDKAQKYAEQALAVIPTVTKPVDSKMPDATFEEFKKDGIARAHGAMGMIAGKRKKWDVAAMEFQTAVDAETQPDPVLMARLGDAYIRIGKPAEAIAILNKVLATPNLNPAVKSFAEGQKKNAEAAKK